MKKTNLILLITLFFTGVYAQKNISFELNDFINYSVLKGEEITLKQPLGNPAQMILVDTLLLLQNPNRDIITDVLNIKTGEIIASFCKRGRGPGEIIYPFPPQYLKETNEFLLHDLNGKKEVFYSLDLVLKGEAKNYTKIVKIDSVYPRRIQLVKDNTFFCGLIGHKNGYMHCKIDMDGNVVKWINKFPDIDIEYNNIVASNIFPTDISVSPDLSTVVVSYSKWGKIEIYDYEGNPIINYFGPDYKKLDIRVGSGNNPVLTSKNIETYWAAVLNNNNFMIPYSGNKYNGIMLFGEILHLDFKGNLIARYKLEPAVADIQVDWENRIIYGLNTEMEPIILKYKF